MVYIPACVAAAGQLAVMQCGSMCGACRSVVSVFDPALCCVHRAAAHSLVCTGTRPEGEGALLGSCSNSTACPGTGHSSAWQESALGLSCDLGWTGLGLAGRRARSGGRRRLAWPGVVCPGLHLGICLLCSPVLLKCRSCTWSGGLAAALCGFVSRPSQLMPRGSCLAPVCRLPRWRWRPLSLELLGLPLARSAGQQLEAVWSRLGPV